MRLAERRVLITGATGDIGRALVALLARQGAHLILVTRAEPAEAALRAALAAAPGEHHWLTGDFLDSNTPERLAAAAIERAGRVDVLVNLAGVAGFAAFDRQSVDDIERMWRVNVLAPIRLTRALLPHMLARACGRIVNIGSVFGSIGFPFFTCYSASKFALRGFSEALRRELKGTGVGVTYVAPRYTRTRFNQGAVARMAAALKMNIDEPDRVAFCIARAIAQERDEYFIGFPEGLFARINGLVPHWVDRALQRQTAQMKEYVAQDINPDRR